MVNYEKIFEPYYEGGWEAYPLETTLITAGALNAYDAAIMHIEDYLDTMVDPNDNLAETYDETATYEVGDYCVYNGVLYKCITAIDEAEEFDIEKWDHVLITDEMGSGGGGGTTVIANPVGEPTDDLETIQIGNTIYNIPGGGGGNANIWTGTQAELEEVFDELEEGTQINITDDEQEVVEGGTIYSEEEQIIGLWTDNKPLYQKTITITNASISGNATIDVTQQLSSLEIDDLVDYDVTITCDSAGHTYNYHDTSLARISIEDDSTYSIALSVSSGTITNLVLNATLKYTKSTDAPLDAVVGKPITFNLANGYADYSNVIFQESYTTTSADYNYEYTATEDCFVVFSNVNGANRDSYARILKDTEILAEVYVSYSSQIIQSGGSTFLRKGEKLLIHSTYQNAQLQIKVYAINVLGVKPVINYSTDEQVIGTYVDGKPIYRKSFTYSSGSLSTGSQLLANDLSNVERVVDKHCQFHSNTDDRDYDIPYFRIAYDESVFLLCHVLTDNTVGTTLISGDHSSYNNIADIVLTLEYTKTTD